MTSIALIASSDSTATNDNATRVGRVLCAQGLQFQRFEHDALALEYGEVVARSETARVELKQFDHIWVFGFGQASSFLDRMQILRMLVTPRFVNHPDALVALHGKISMRAFDGVPCIPAILSNRPDDLMRELASGGEWVIKPPAGSFGRDVFVLREGDRNQRAIVESMTRDGRYALLERFVASEGGVEKRALLSGATVVGCYAKRPTDHRGNVAAGMTVVETEISDSERKLLKGIAQGLEERGVRFAAVDFIAPYVIEVNVANPGFLATFEALTGVDATPAVVAALFE